MIDRRQYEWSNKAAEHLVGLRYPEDTGQPVLNLLRAPEFVAYFETEDYSRPLELPSPQHHSSHLQVHITFFGKRSRLLFIRDVTQTYRLEQMRKDFVANVSHELRTPLTVINGYLETFADSVGDTNPRWRRALDQMLIQSRRMQTLISDLLSLARLESLPLGAEQEGITVRPLLEMIREEALASAAGPREISIECDDSLRLLGRAEELRSAFANLVHNAARYTNNGGNIWIRWYADREHAYLQVEDNGIGIEPASRASPNAFTVSTKVAPWIPAAQGWGWPSSSTSCCAIRRRCRSLLRRNKAAVLPLFSRWRAPCVTRWPPMAEAPVVATSRHRIFCKPSQ